ncbi:hypothetical protein JCM11251_006392 [Rhodosporidiobolus azoricus]
MAPPVEEDGYELADATPDLATRSAGNHKGKERERDDHDLDDEDSDAEIEELLRVDAALPADATTTEHEAAPFAGGTGERRMREDEVAGGSGGTRGTGGARGKLLGGSTASQRKKFAKEMLRETLPVLLFSLFGAVLTGELLERLQTWRVFIRIEELFILVPILLNLKGNLEMNLAARFSTSANIGELDLRATRRSLVLGNLALLQVQALIVSLISGLLAFALGVASRKGVHHSLQHPAYGAGSDETAALRGGYFEALLVLCVSMLAASLSSGVLGSFMCSMVILCRRFRVNPDNVATPLASALGDMVTLVILGLLSSLFIIFMGTIISTLVFLALLGAVALNVVITFRNAYVQELLTIGWGPLFVAMAISSGSGVVLKTYITSYPGFGLVSTALNALTGGAGSIFVSRISTALHSGRREHYVVSAVSLALLTGAVLGLFGIFAWGTGQSPGGVGWALGWAMVVLVQISIALFLAYQGTLLLWRWDYDPDVYALPLLTSFLDVSGQLLLVACYALVKKITGADWSDDASDAADAAQASATATITAASAAATAAATALGLR